MTRITLDKQIETTDVNRAVVFQKIVKLKQVRCTDVNCANHGDWRRTVGGATKVAKEEQGCREKEKEKTRSAHHRDAATCDGSAFTSLLGNLGNTKNQQREKPVSVAK